MFRNSILATLLLFFGFAAFAQENTSSLINAKIKDGTILVGGTLGATYQKYSHDNIKTGKKETGDLITARLSAKSGYFFFPDFAVGLNVAVDHTSINVDSTRYGEKRTFVLAGPFVRYYFNNGIFTELNINAGVDAIKGGTKTDIKSGSLSLGYAYFLNSVVSIEPMLSFNYVENRVDNNNQDTKDRQFGPVLAIGIQAYLYSPTRVLPTK